MMQFSVKNKTIRLVYMDLETETLKTSAMKYVRFLVPYLAQFVYGKMEPNYKINIQII